MDRVSALLQFLEEDPEDEFTRFALAMEYVRAGQEEQARAALEKLREDSPGYVGTYYHLAAVYRRLGLREAAEETYRSGIAVAERQRELHALSELRSALLDLEDAGHDEDG